MRPDHLCLGTHAANVADKVMKGRQARGETHGRAKLNDDAVREILALHHSGVGVMELGRRFGVDHRAIGRVVRRQTWRHVGMDAGMDAATKTKKAG